jgi:putative transposase
VNHKRVFRVYRAAGLSVKRKKRKRLMRIGQPVFTASRHNQQWAIDFVHDRMANGRTIRVLSVMDTFTRECLALEVDTCLPSRRVTRALDRVIAIRGKPERIRMDNGLNATSFFGSRQKISSGRRKRQPMRHKLPNNQGNPVVFHEDWETR